MPRFSVIMPIYNAEKFLQDTIGTFLNQTYKDFELVLINDGSKDGSLDVCNEFARKDNRVKVFSQENKGLTITRNRGIDEATGEYVWTIDSDDEIPLDALEKISQCIDIHGPDIVRFNYATVHDRKTTHHILNQPYNVKLDKRYIAQNVFPYAVGLLDDTSKRIWGPWAYCVSREMLKQNQIKYNEKKRKEEDLQFLVTCFAYAQSCVFLEDTLYYYIKRKGSLISTYSPRFWNILDSFQTYEALAPVVTENTGVVYDFHSQQKLLYNIRNSMECLMFVLFHWRDCESYKEIKDILSNEHMVGWFREIDPAKLNFSEKRIRSFCLGHAYRSAYVFMWGCVFAHRFRNLLRKIGN